MISFWRWFFRGQGKGHAGLVSKLVNYWLFVHGAVGLALALLVPVSLKDAANSFLLPLAGVFIGLSFAWGGNAQALLQTSEIEDLADHHEEGFESYVYTFQTAILVILTTLTLWGLAGLGIFDLRWPTQKSRVIYSALASVLYSLASLTLRECWHVVLGSQLLLLSRRRIRRSQNPRGGQDSSRPPG